MKFKLAKIFIAGVPFILAACGGGNATNVSENGGGNATNVSDIGFKQDDTLVSDETISEIAQDLETGRVINLQADGLHAVRTFSDSNFQNATTEWVGSETVTAEITKDDDGEYVITLNHDDRETTFTIDDLNQEGFEYVKNIEGDDITAYLWTVDDTWDDILSGTGNYKYMVRLGTSTYNEETFVNGRTYFVSGIAPSDVPTQNTVDYAGDMRGEYSDAGSEVGDFDAKIFLTLDFSKATVDGKIPISDFEGDTNPYLKINTANVKNNQFTTTVELMDCTDQSCPTIIASQLTGGLYGPGAAESGGTFVAEGISFGGDDYGPEDPKDYTVISVWGAKKQ
jgi:hypothetical protein